MRKIFDAHFHIVDLGFPLWSNAGFLPEPFGVGDYLDRVASLGVAGGALVSGSFQGFDQGYLLAALERLGPGFVGVTQLPASVSDRAIQRLDARNVRGLRFNLRRGGSMSLREVESLARRVQDLVGWHSEVYADTGDLSGLEPLLRRLPAVSIDHLGLSRRGLPRLLRLVEHGARVKASGFGRVDFDVGEALQAIHRADPGALMFGTDLPSTRAPRPFSDVDVGLVIDALGEEGAELALWENARAFYRLA
ncbi:amidohydrolase family protein [Imhoffiella purpurea]|uniref:(2-pyrone-4,6-)dicarboxylic acid hydrolase n=1 Tax=Imhoffiella purpurea TaxID=1249627 RepID=W9VH39_9GAMM|nr:amidohydrolase family protein [Imhoffiella purpurea]EXJ15342.1 (2-pyrone-4,6-)dicarboxylic acid hydrolase [Imhoffiella purpurea]